MSIYRSVLPQLGGDLFLTDGGLETTLIFLEGIDLPSFAAFILLDQPDGEEALRRYFRGYIAIAQRAGVGVILESPTWRANPEWGARLGYDATALAAANRRAVELLEEVRAEPRSRGTRVVISGCVGPRDDGYHPTSWMVADEAAAYHSAQVRTFASTAADMVSAMTMTYPEEAIGIALAARREGLPVAISFTVETDGRLPNGQTLRSAISQVDRATSRYPLYYMINCAHPTHFDHVLPSDESWVSRIRGLRANASCRSHAELNESPDLDAGDPMELGMQYAHLRWRLSHLNVLGGCCGTDTRHIEEIARTCSVVRPRRFQLEGFEGGRSRRWQDDRVERVGVGRRVHARM